MRERKGLIRWIKKHKRELIVAGFSIAALILLVLGIKNRETLKAIWDSLQSSVNQPTTRAEEIVTNVNVGIIPQAQVVAFSSQPVSDSFPFEVSSHVRNLPEGWHASPEKIASALENDFVLEDGQTWVESYMKGGDAA